MLRAHMPSPIDPAWHAGAARHKERARRARLLRLLQPLLCVCCSLRRTHSRRRLRRTICEQAAAIVNQASGVLSGELASESR